MMFQGCDKILNNNRISGQKKRLSRVMHRQALGLDRKRNQPESAQDYELGFLVEQMHTVAVDGQG